MPSAFLQAWEQHHLANLLTFIGKILTLSDAGGAANAPRLLLLQFPDKKLLGKVAIFFPEIYESKVGDYFLQSDKI